MCTWPTPSCLTRGGLEDANTGGAFLSFSGDAEDEPVDLFAEAQKAVDEAEAAQAEEEEDDEAEFHAAPPHVSTHMFIACCLVHCV